MTQLIAASVAARGVLFGNAQLHASHLQAQEFGKLINHFDPLSTFSSGEPCKSIRVECKPTIFAPAIKPQPVVIHRTNIIHTITAPIRISSQGAANVRGHEIAMQHEKT
ncbi:hypothetical protein GUJ93_ZPchr0013g35491 [Zizania palustris]|uniref:Uncharacterized protein n=1 Tax=Zizania palustris TaxID=103762 RepID=A0A8J5WX65_ZIZPA|nr:hypothetical protein GUJ93_ZPchr0013g35491 [Zizania palustris]